jgi:hypothetical protein
LGFLLAVKVGNRLLTPRPIRQGVSDWLATVKPPQVRTFMANQTEKTCAYVLDFRGADEYRYIEVVVDHAAYSRHARIPRNPIPFCDHSLGIP